MGCNRGQQGRVVVVVVVVAGLVCARGLARKQASQPGTGSIGPSRKPVEGSASQG